MSPDAPTEITLIAALAERIRACRMTSQGIAPPAAILWTDPGREWRPILSELRDEIPELLTLGEFDPDARTGPAIWLRCVADRALEPEGWPDGTTPILYLPGVARQHLRAGLECPRPLQPLVELMFRGTLWLQRNGYDWTLTAFLTSPNGGLGLDLARDEETLQALPRALPEVARTPIAHLEGRRLTGESFDRLLTADPVRDLLRWMGDPASRRGKPDENRWQALRNRWKEDFGFDPETDGDLVAGQLMGKGEGAWARVWDRYVEAPTAFPGIPALLRRSRPTDLFMDRSRWPTENESAEDEVRAELERVADLPHPEACAVVLELEEAHGERRRWVWAKLGEARLAEVLEPLAVVAGYVGSALGGGTPDEVASVYAAGPWQADAAAWRALALAPPSATELVGRVVRALLLPWQDASARAFQKCLHGAGVLSPEAQPRVGVPEGGCLVFADGLRFDLGQTLAHRLETSGCQVRLSHRWAALPSVTATAKPAVTPVADQIQGDEMPDDFAPHFQKDGRPVVAARLRAVLKDAGYQVLGSELGDWPASKEARGWSEEGQIDSLGHKLHARLATQIDEELERLAIRILALLEGGWTSVRVVTDHGWLLLPGGLPKVDLPKHLTESRWSRCAKIAGASEPGVPTAPWHWNSEAHFATAPGIACFNNSPEYAHGGISIQECLIPDLVVERAAGSRTRASIEKVTWRGMRCVVDAMVSGEGIRADLRLGGAMGPRVAVAAKKLDTDGRASLVVGDDEHEGAAATVVLIGPDETILAQQNTTVGES